MHLIILLYAFNSISVICIARAASDEIQIITALAASFRSDAKVSHQAVTGSRTSERRDENFLAADVFCDLRSARSR